MIPGNVVQIYLQNATNIGNLVQEFVILVSHVWLASPVLRVRETHSRNRSQQALSLYRSSVLAT